MIMNNIKIGVSTSINCYVFTHKVIKVSKLLIMSIYHDIMTNNQTSNPKGLKNIMDMCKKNWGRIYLNLMHW